MTSLLFDDAEFLLPCADEISVITLINFEGLIRSILDGFPSNFTLFIIPRVGRSIIIFIIFIVHLERERVDRSGKGSCKILVEVFNVVLIS